MCFGSPSEKLHDLIDDCIVEESVLCGRIDYEQAITTYYHENETIEETTE